MPGKLLNGVKSSPDAASCIEMCIFVSGSMRLYALTRTWPAVLFKYDQWFLFNTGTDTRAGNDVELTVAPAKVPKTSGTQLLLIHHRPVKSKPNSFNLTSMFSHVRPRASQAQQTLATMNVRKLGAL